MHAWGPQRCKSKVLRQTEENHIDGEDQREGREFSMVIDNLRMATKYSFHVRQLSDGDEIRQPKGRGFSGEEEEEEGLGNDLKGETIIIPTKGCE